MHLVHTLDGTNWTFDDLKDVLAKASPLRSGDVPTSDSSGWVTGGSGRNRTTDTRIFNYGDGPK
jgi:ethanolamine ammonia-lyase large subunit